MASRRWLNPPAGVWAGLLYGLSFPAWPGVELGFLAWFALLPLLHALHPARDWRTAGAEMFRFAALGSLIAGRWVLEAGLMVGNLAILWHTLLLLPPLLAFHALQRARGRGWALASLPFLWGGWEALADLVQPFHWAGLGESQVGLIWLIQYADLTGVWGIGAWVVACNALLAWGWRCWRSAAALVALFGLPLAYAGWVVAVLPEGGDTVRIAWVQPDSSPVAVNHLYALSRQAATQEHPDLLVWPESVFRGRPLDETVGGPLHRLILDNRMALLAPYIEESYPAGYQGRAVQIAKALLATPERVQGAPAEWLPGYYPAQAKRQLVPHAEQRLLPDAFADWLWQTHRIWLPDLTVGTQATPLPLSSALALGVLLCYDAYFPQVAAELAGAGANILVVVANEENHFGDSIAAWQGASMARLRAIENRRPLLRVSSGAYSGAVDRFGRFDELAADGPAIGSHLLAAGSGLTWFSRHPLSFAALCWLLSAGVLAWAAAHRLKALQNSLTFKGATP